MSNTMGERLKSIRLDKKMSQSELGDILGVGNTAISKLEKGERNFTSQMKKLIYSKLSVNEEFLENGTGSMYKTLNRDEEIAAWAGTVLSPDMDDNYMRKFAHVLSRLTKEDWEVLKRMSEMMCEEMSNNDEAEK